MVRKAVFPAAGMGTRFLPATKAQPKEMLPIVDRPIIQYAIEEVVQAGIKQTIIVTGRGKRAIEDHFDMAFELEKLLEDKEKDDLLKQIDEIDKLIDASPMCYIRQKQALGLGHAIMITETLIGHEPFAVVLADDVIHSQVPAIKQLIDIHHRFKCSVVAVMKVPRDQTNKYGIISGREIRKGLWQVHDLVEKPDPEEAPSEYAIIGRYVLTPEIFEYLHDTSADKRGEIQITDAMKKLLSRQAIYAFEFEGVRYDAGSKIGFLKATVETALRRPDLNKEFAEYLSQLDFTKFVGSDKKK